MLEQEIKSWKNKLAVGLAGLGLIAGAYSCGPSAHVPVGYYSSDGQKPIPNCSGISCCDMLSCSSKGYDYCRDEGIESLDGVLYANCSCHDYTHSGSSSSTSSSSYRDYGGYDREGGAGIDDHAHGHTVCK